MRAIVIAATLLAIPTPALAAPDDTPRISVSATASVQTPPDRATIQYTVHGEGASSDEAVASMVGKRERIDGGLASLHVAVEAGTSRVAVTEARGPDCRQNYGSARLSTGTCAIQGYAADMTVTLRTAAVTKVGTVVGLLGRLGATEPRLESFSLAALGDAQRRAIAAALADARAKAEAVAQGTARG
ncbi:SIMPL domain-containing protein [uncultured Sphingomonas sp.]|uniref:SIMPL domain-containing protein n=1 Tax=uncultured Sphingomonas sp. TaxID=158754 RepID=UPI0035CC75D0